MRRYALRDDQWDRIKDILPGREGHVGATAKDNRLFVEAVLYRYRAGIPWRDLPERYGPWETVYYRFRRWQKDGTLQRLLDRLQLKLDELGRIDWDTWCVDGSNIRAGRPAAGAKKGAPKQHSDARTAAGARNSIC